MHFEYILFREKKKRGQDALGGAGRFLYKAIGHVTEAFNSVIRTS